MKTVDTWSKSITAYLCGCIHSKGNIQPSPFPHVIVNNTTKTTSAKEVVEVLGKVGIKAYIRKGSKSSFSGNQRWKVILSSEKQTN